MYKQIIKPLLFNFSTEEAHGIAMKGANLCVKLPLGKHLLRSIAGKNIGQESTHFGLNFKNRVGLAAGFDKDGNYIESLQQLGFGHIEVGTVTPRPQSGNPKPRLFRLKEDEALINRMGFNNKGVHNLAENIRQLPEDRPIIGGNIGKNKDTPNEDAWEDYVYCFKYLHEQVDYFTINLSSPNTPGLRALQEKEPLIKIISSVQEINAGLAKPKPILLKISPDNERSVYDDIIEVATACKLDGLIATNTTIDRQGLKASDDLLEVIGAGGLSGQPLTEKSLEVVKYLRAKMPAEMTLVGVGGISNKEQAEAMMASGADLVQLYTSFIYEGPGIVGRLV